MRKQRTALYRSLNRWLEANRKNNKNRICEYYRIYEHEDGTITDAHPNVIILGGDSVMEINLNVVN